MRTVVGLLLVMVLLAVPARAFDGYEHRSVSNAALLAAVRYAEKTADPKFLAQARFLAMKEHDTFGDLTVAVDWFQDVTKLTTISAFDAVGPRQRFNQALRRAMSVHRNTLHFQRQALCSYRAFHRNAMAYAADPLMWTEALYTEAVALHFLQDFFSAGHFITPRKSSHDAVAGSLHDHFGRVGLKLSVNLAHGGQLDEPWRSLAAAALAECPGFPSKGLLFFDDDFNSLNENREVRIGGDGRLEEVAAQRFLVLLLSAKSIAEVLEASKDGSPTQLNECFSLRGAVWTEPPRSYHVLRQSNEKVVPKGGVTLEKRVAVTPEPVTLDFLRDAKCEKEVPRCEDTFAPAVSYDVMKEDYSSDGLFDARGVQVTIAGLPLVRRSISIGRLVKGWDPPGSVEAYDEKMTPTDETYSEVWGVLYSAFALSFVESSDYRAIGGRVELALAPYKRVGGTIMLGPGIYKWSGGRTTRLDVGLKLTFGLEVVNVALLLERAHEVDESGRFRSRYFVTPGVELTLSNSWLRSVFHRKGRPCCKGE
ncbi:MAG: hypothetical protein QOI24_3660 [Acidobacteriota bacterium]|jgi:hypothetical protein|nr:hypothetical protein [Acidobacteriota bacterium]